MNAPLHPIVLEARFAQLATSLLQGERVSDAALAAVGGTARRALRGFGAAVDSHESARLGFAASRLAHRLLALRGGVVALEQSVIRLGVEMDLLLDPVDLVSIVRSVRDGSAQLPAAGNSIGEPAFAQAKLFAQIALVAVLARSRAP